MSEKTYKLEEPMVVTNQNQESDRSDVEKAVELAMRDLQDRILDPTTEAVVLTAVIRGGDDSVTVADLCLDHRQNENNDSRMNYMTASWKHQVPESVFKVYDELASGLGIYVNDLGEPDDNFETTGIALGDPSNELIFTTASSAPANVFANDDEANEGVDSEEEDAEI